MLVLFLDINGVLIPLPTSDEQIDDPQPSREAIENLNLLVQVTGANVVISSTWRVDRSVTELDALLKSWGFRYDVLDKTTQSGGDDDRAKDIQTWLDAHHGVENFVILDDDRQELAELAKHWVMPKPDVGLQLHDVSQAIRILREVR
jgi:hypothetical protein